jgi:SET domain-containing protein
MKFTGCACPKGDSPCSQESDTCPCVLLGRECDPDLCHHCGAEQTVNPFISNHILPPNACRNTDIQRGHRKRLLVGESSHPGDIGFGAYMAEPVEKGEFIAEYVGEIISYAECARRSEIYNKLKVSFLFDLNKEVAIDSYRYGNIERFINHSKKHANCKPSVRLVNGEHRIGFFAMKHLDAGVELFFDYGKAFVENQGLKEMGDSSKKSITGPKTTRKLFKGKGGASKQKGRLSRGVGNLVNEVDDTMIDDELLPALTHSVPNEEEVDEYDDEMDIVGKPSGRPRRNVRIPKKYTR